RQGRQTSSPHPVGHHAKPDRNYPFYHWLVAALVRTSRRSWGVQRCTLNDSRRRRKERSSEARKDSTRLQQSLPTSALVFRVQSLGDDQERLRQVGQLPGEHGRQSRGSNCHRSEKN